MRRQFTSLVGAASALCIWSAATPATVLQPYMSGLSSPVFLTHAGDGSNRVFVVEQAGRIQVVQPGSTTPTVFLNITSRVAFGGEQGLLGLAFHPQYASNGRFFVDYTRQPDGATVIAEYHVSGDPNVADPTETALLTIAQPFANHNGGMLAFGFDGDLYIGMGDGGSGNDPGNRAQDINQLLGKILRIDVSVPGSYSAPATNPFAGATPGADEIYAYGLRNPWRFSFDRANGTLWVGDVGQSAWEEVDTVTLGGNYGWRIFEGAHCSGNDPGLCGGSGFTGPVTEYAHSSGRCSITGGYVYRGGAGALPLGQYIYGDFCTGEIFALNAGVLFDTTLSISSFGEDEAGELYVVSLDGTIQKLASGVPQPTATRTPTPLVPPPSASVTPTSTNTPMRCGNSVVDGGEQCDDGNSLSGDGCSATCESELITDSLPRSTDCMHEWLTNPPPARNAKGLPFNRLTCTDDDPTCDFGPAGDATCTFHVALCLNVAEQRFACAPTDVARVQIQQPNELRPRDPTDTANRDALEGALAGTAGVVRGQCTNRGVKQKQSCSSSADCDSFPGSADGRCKGRLVAFEPPLAAYGCTAFADIRVPLRQTAAGMRARRKRLRLSVSPSNDPLTGLKRAGDTDSLTLICNPKS
jgi:cysteine-rich repeat protein